jgi:hypothetical protein
MRTFNGSIQLFRRRVGIKRDKEEGDGERTG